MAANVDIANADIESDGSDIDIPSDIESDSDGDDTVFTGGVSVEQFNFVEPEWTDSFVDFTIPHFTEASGPSLPDDFDCASATPLKYFQLFFTPEMVEKIAENTNIYAEYQQEMKRIVRPDYVDAVWRETNCNEIYAYLALNILFGINPAPFYRLYWSSDPWLCNIAVRRLMTVNRYEKISSYIHINNRRTEITQRDNPAYDKLAKVRPVITAVGEACMKYSKPSKNQSIDEGMVKFAGRLSYVQYMPAKPVKRGLKVWIRADAESGYLNQFEVYLGKKSVEPSAFGIYFDIIDNLTTVLKGKNHHVYFDNLYTSIPVLQYLRQNCIFACGTLRSNRKYLPLAVRNPPRLERGASKVFQDENCRQLTCAVWSDTKLVRFASTLSKPNLVTTTVRRVGAQQNQVTQPAIASQYSRFMGGVDVFDALRAVYKSGRASKRSWKYIFWFTLDIGLTNSFLLYKKTSTRATKKNYTQFDFRHELVKELSAMYTDKPNGNVQLSVDHTSAHMLAKRPKVCRAHRDNFPSEKAKETVFGCRACNVHLCKKCHCKYHGNTT